MYVPLDWLAPVAVLLVALTLGVCAHELLHAVPLHLVDATYTVTLLPTDDATAPTAWAMLQNALTGGLVRVEVTHLPRAAPDWVVRVAALLPIVVALPLLLTAAGIFPDPTATDDHVATAVLVASGACGLPSPADWSVVWYGADRYQ